MAEQPRCYELLPQILPRLDPPAHRLLHAIGATAWKLVAALPRTDVLLSNAIRFRHCRPLDAVRVDAMAAIVSERGCRAAPGFRTGRVRVLPSLAGRDCKAAEMARRMLGIAARGIIERFAAAVAHGPSSPIGCSRNRELARGLGKGMTLALSIAV